MHRAIGVLEREVRDAQRRARSVRWNIGLPEAAVGLCIADMDLATPSFILDALAHRLEYPFLGYTLVDERLTEALQSWYRSQHLWSLAEGTAVFLPFGAKATLHLALSTFADMRRPVCVMNPGYGGIGKVIRGAGGRVAPMDMRVQGPCQYYVDPAQLDRFLIDTNAGTLVLCNPHNPIGAVWPRDVLAAVASVVARRKVLVISDEVHSSLVFPGHVHYPWGSVALARDWIMIDSIGKGFNASGLDSSWLIAGDETAASALRSELRSRGFYEGGLVGNVATYAALTLGHRWLSQRIQTLHQRMRLACDALDRCGWIPHAQPAASFLLWMDLRQLRLEDGRTAAGVLLERASVRVLDGSRFGDSYAGFCRLNIATTRPILEAALTRIAALNR
jgi:cysteine-S-conjugate beta-lyase